MKRRVTRDVDSGRLLEDLWIGDRTPERLLRRELRMPANLETRVELLAVDEPANGDFDDRPMEPHDASLYRAAVARTNFLAQDRCDLQFASKECSRWMSSPRVGDWATIKRIGRYLIGKPRVASMFCWQDEPAGLSVFSDSNWAGCRETRKSTSGAVFMNGAHLIKSYSRTQSNIALSSAEAELYAMVSAASEGLGLAAMIKDCGRIVEPHLKVDATAAIGIAQRKGLGKLRHLDTQSLWIQDAVRQRRVHLEKVLGTENPSDLLTKHLDAKTIEKYMTKMGVVALEGRAGTAPELAQKAAKKVELENEAVDKAKYINAMFENKTKGVGRMVWADADYYDD